jgi:hypothetical protein
MSEKEQEKLYELLFKDTKNKLETTIEKLRIANAELRDELDKKNSEIEEQQNKIVSLQKEIKLMKSININDNYISKDKIREKIKELEKEKLPIVYNTKNIKISNQIKILEELLEE